MAEASIMFTNNTPTAANNQHTFTFNALLELDSTQTISGATVTFRFGDGSSATATTGTNGIATVTHMYALCSVTFSMQLCRASARAPGTATGSGMSRVIHAGDHLSATAIHGGATVTHKHTFVLSHNNTLRARQRGSGASSVPLYQVFIMLQLLKQHHGFFCALSSNLGRWSGDTQRWVCS